MADPTRTLTNLHRHDPATVFRRPVAAGEEIYEGALCSYDTAGNVVNADDTGAVVGVALDSVLNTTAEGYGGAGEVSIRLAYRAIARYNGTSALAATDMTGVGRRVYAVDGQSVTDVPGAFPAGIVIMAEDTMDKDGFTDVVMVAVGYGSMGSAGAAQLGVIFGTVAFTDTANKTLGTLPPNAVVVDFFRNVTTAFDAGTTNVLDVGTTVGDPDEYIDADDVTSTGLTRAGSGGTMPATALGSIGAVALPLYGKYTGTGTTETAGVAQVAVFYYVA